MAATDEAAESSSTGVSPLFYTFLSGEPERKSHSRSPYSDMSLESSTTISDDKKLVRKPQRTPDDDSEIIDLTWQEDGAGSPGLPALLRTSSLAQARSTTFRSGVLVIATALPDSSVPGIQMQGTLCASSASTSSRSEGSRNSPAKLPEASLHFSEMAPHDPEVPNIEAVMFHDALQSLSPQSRLNSPVNCRSQSPFPVLSQLGSDSSMKSISRQGPSSRVRVASLTAPALRENLLRLYENTFSLPREVHDKPRRLLRFSPRSPLLVSSHGYIEEVDVVGRRFVSSCREELRALIATSIVGIGCVFLMNLRRSLLKMRVV
jgi:hypothetical protein